MRKRAIGHDGMSKTCGACKRNLPLDEFSKRTDRRGGVQSKCRKCYAIWRKKYYLETKEAQIKKVDEYRRANPERKAKWDRTYESVHRDKVRKINRRSEMNRRARKRTQFIEYVDPKVVYQMHGGMCGICKDFVSEDNFHVDHIIPLIKGGVHGYINVQPAYPKCNLVKGGR